MDPARNFTPENGTQRSGNAKLSYFMPIYKTYKVPNNTQLLIWNITEDEPELRYGIKLTDLCNNRLAKMKSKTHRCGFLSVRQLLANVGYSPGALRYDAFGKPHLHDGKYISISHSHGFAVIAFGDKPIGIDVEKERPKVHLIASKFLHASEMVSNPSDRIITTQWCIKESAYKALGKKSISFLNDIRMTNINTKHPIAHVRNQSGSIILKNWLFYWKNYSCCLAIKID